MTDNSSNTYLHNGMYKHFGDQNMLINECILEGYKLLGLSGINRIVIRPNSSFQIILGCNGSGKSSLMRELSVLPANPSFYNKDGFKQVTVLHNNNTYVLTSNFKDKKPHSFLKNGEEKNDGGLITIQRELVRQEFGLTQELYEVLTGQTRFTRMGTAKRRELIQMMSDGDLTYALGVYKKVTTIMRDHQGTVKHLKGRLAKETEKLMAMEVDDGLEELADRLHGELNALLEAKQRGLDPSYKVKDQLNGILHDISVVSKEILSIRFDNRLGVKGIDELRAEITRRQSDVESKRRVIDHYSKEHEKLVRLVSTFEDSGVANIDELRDKFNTLISDSQKLKEQVKQFTFEGDITELLATSDNLATQLYDLLNEIPDNHDKRYSRTKLQETEENIARLQQEIAKADHQEKRVRVDIEHIQNAKHSKCPQCGYKWIDGVSEGDLERLHNIAAACAKASQKASQELKEAHTYRDEILNYSAQMSRFKTLMYNYPRAGNLFDWFMSEDRLYFQPKQYGHVIDTWKYDLRLHSEIWSLKQQIDVIEKALRSAEALAETGAQHFTDNLAQLENQVHTLTDEVKITELQLSDFKSEISKVNRILELESELKRLLAKGKETQLAFYQSITNEGIEEVTRQHQQQLALWTHRINEKKSLEGILSDLRRSLDEVERSFNTHKLLAKALSPTDGVIAKSMTEFIGCMTEQMNEIIAQIWTSPLNVKPCGISTGELDYKFPLISGNDDVTATDVSDGSDGQQEIVDFAFRLVAILYLGLSDYPLYLDEIGRPLDETHMTNIMNYVKVLIDAHRHSQLFMISHFAAFHGAFTTADFIVLNGNNITIPNRANQFVEIS
jgi:rubrerythrin